jgi:hypothetical protein
MAVIMPVLMPSFNYGEQNGNGGYETNDKCNEFISAFLYHVI